MRNALVTMATQWPGRSDAHGRDANYGPSAVKRTDHATFVAVRVRHWSTLYTQGTAGSGWKVVAPRGP